MRDTDATPVQGRATPATRHGEAKETQNFLLPPRTPIGTGGTVANQIEPLVK
jgi:hypothetical protein